MLTPDIKGKPVEEILDATWSLRLKFRSVIILNLIAESSVHRKSDTRALGAVKLPRFAKEAYGVAIMTILAVIPMLPGIKQTRRRLPSVTARWSSGMRCCTAWSCASDLTKLLCLSLQRSFYGAKQHGPWSGAGSNAGGHA